MTSGVLQAADFKIVGDGQTDNSVALIALRDHIRAGADRVWQVEFEPGHYCYADNRWLTFGDRAVILDFNNAKVECIADAILPLGAGPLVWKPEYPAPPTTDHFQPGHLIENVRAVDKGGFVQTDTVTLKEAVAAQFQSGDRVLVAGYIQQTTEDESAAWGWPPNFRYFEWKTVREVVDGRTLRFQDPFRFSYDAAWPDLPDGSSSRFYGAPRIWRLRLDDGRQPNRWLKIRNANFIGGRSRAPGTETPIAGTGWHVTFEGCTADANTVCWPTVAKRNDFIDCQLGCRQVELDKIVESVRFERCDIRGWLASGGAGVLDVSFRDCNLYGFVQLTPRSWRHDGCRFYNGLHLAAGLTNTPFALTGTASAV
jgi:hypothetical protein